MSDDYADVYGFGFAEKVASEKKETPEIKETEQKSEQPKTTCESLTIVGELLYTQLGKLKSLLETTNILETKCPNDPNLPTVMMPRDKFNEIMKTVVEISKHVSQQRAYDVKFKEENSKLILELNAQQKGMHTIAETAREATVKLYQFAELATKQQKTIETQQQEIVDLQETLKLHSKPKFQITEAMHHKENNEPNHQNPYKPGEYKP